MALSQEELRALDQLRTRLSALASNLAKLRLNLQQQDPIPSWPSLQSSAQLLMHHINQIQQTFQQHEDFFKTAHVYPTPAFPGHTQHDLLQQLLRKKLDPRVEDHILARTKPLSQKPGALEERELLELWNWAGPASQDILRPMLESGAMDDVFTLKEQEEGVENVNTGLKRKLYDLEGDEDDIEENKEDEDKMDEDVVPDESQRKKEEEQRLGVEEGRPAVPLEAMLKFISTGSPLQLG